MNLLLWNWGRRGGGPRFTLELAHALADRNADGIYLSLSRQSELFAETEALGLPGFHVDTYSNATSALLATARLGELRNAMARFVAEKKIDVVLVTMRHVWGPLVMDALHGVDRRAKVVLVVHDAEPHPGDSFPFWRWCFEREFALSDHLVALTSHVQGRLRERFGIPLEKTSVVALPAFTFPGVEGSLRRLPLDRPPRLLYFGRIKLYKGLDVLLEAVRLVQERREVELVIAGMGDIEPYREQLAKVKRLDLQNRWITEDEVAAILSSCDVMVAAHKESSQSGVVPTALSAGMPVVTTPVGGLVEQVRAGESGLVASEATPEALADAVLRLLDDPELYARCSAEALALARGPFSWSAAADALLGIARDVVTGAA